MTATRGRKWARAALSAAALGLALAALAWPARADATAPASFRVVAMPGTSGSSESRNTVTPDGTRWIMTNASDGTAAVYASRDAGATWHRTATDPDQIRATTDVDLVSTHTGRLIATELDDAGISFHTSYSDDGGKTWTRSIGTTFADTDRPWLAVGPDDPTSHQPRVYLLFHDLLSGTIQHNMFVSTSTDGGATFGLPIPTTLPGQQAYLDLQCADSGGPSNIVVNQRTGRIYAIFGTRSSAAGGCGASVTGPFEINVVAATRIWVATSPDGTLGSWTQSMAVDDNATNQIVGMQLGPGALDNGGNLWVAYPESPRAYPDYDGAAIRVRWAPSDLSRWSTPITIAAGGGAGNVLPHIVAGDPGRFDVAWWGGEPRPGTTPAWFEMNAQVLDGFDPRPSVDVSRLSNVVVDTGTASLLMGACGSGPVAGVENGFACGRSADVWGIALDTSCGVLLSWPAQSAEAHMVNATFAAQQRGGPSLCATQASPAGVAPVANPGSPASASPGLANTAGGGSSPWPAAAAGAIVASCLVAAGGRRRRRGAAV